MKTTFSPSIMNDQTDSLLQKLFQYHDKWNFSDNLIVNIQEKFSIRLDFHMKDEIDEMIGLEKKVIVELFKHLTELKLLEDRETNNKFQELASKVHYAQQLIYQYLAFNKKLGNDTSMFMFTEFKYNELKPFQKLLFYLFDFMEANNFKRVGEYVYEEIRNPYATHAWKSRCKIIDLVNEQFTMTKNYTHWILFTTNKDMDKHLTEHLIRTKDNRFPLLKKHRNIFAFKNGIYISKKRARYPEIDDCFVEYDSPMASVLDRSYVACKYFDIEFTSSCDTPVLDSIFLYQGLSPEVIEINKMFIGRMLYNIGQLDNWQVILMLLGTGGTGKSTINNIVRMFYDSEDVAVIGNNFQTLFGLADIYEKFAFIAPEIKKDWKIDQAEFQEIVSGGKLNINIKHQSSVMVDWKTPGMLGGNESPGFVDNASSIQRRIVVTRFDKKVQYGDPDLSKKLELEVGNILKCCNTLYLKYVHLHGRQDIWNWLPTYFIDTQQLMATAVNPLIAFLKSNKVELFVSNKIPMDIFFKQFNMFCTDNNFRKPRITVDFYRAPFAKMNIELMTLTDTYNSKLYSNTVFLVGVDVINYMES